jgi:Ca2+-binding EF-hand superfamily protein
MKQMFMMAAAVLVFVGAGRAEDKPAKKAKGPDLNAVFTKLDADKDGKLSSSEFANATAELKKKKEGETPAKTKTNKMADALFAKLDADKDGKLSKEEFAKVVETMKAMKQDKKK